MEEIQKETCGPQKLTLRDMPCEFFEKIEDAKAKIKANNPHRTGKVSNEEALKKLVLG